METDTSSRRAHSLRAVLLSTESSDSASWIAAGIAAIKFEMHVARPCDSQLVELSVNGTGADIQTEELVCASTSQVSLCCRPIAFISQ